MSRKKQGRQNRQAAGRQPTAQRLLPTTLWELPLTKLRMTDGVSERLAKRGLLTVGDLLELTPASFSARGKLPPDDCEVVVAALTRALDDGLRQFASAACDDWPTIRAQLLGPLDDAGRALFTGAVGIEQPVMARPALQQLVAQGTTLDESLDRVRATLLQHCSHLLGRLRREIEQELKVFDGVLYAQHASRDSMIRMLAEACDDDQIGLRLAAFCLTHECHFHRGVLHGMSPRRFRELLRTLPQMLPQHRLPLPIGQILAQLSDAGLEVPHGVLLHVLRTELHTAIELDHAQGEMAVPDPRTPTARLVEILTEIGEPSTLEDLVFAYRERFRFASQARLLRHLSGSKAFLCIGPQTWALRQWYPQALADVAPIVEKVARWICSEGGRHRIADLISPEDGDEHTQWLVLDCLKDDPRVRLLGRGEACPADQHQSTVMERLMRAFRRAAGDVVKSRFIENQPPAQRRLVERLLQHNRAFVQPSADRIDTLTNYPFNAERMERLINLVRDQLQKRTGYAQTEALKDAVDQADLGGKWLSPELLADILRRNGPFEVLPGIVALADLSLPKSLLRATRMALRELDEAFTVEDVVRARPDLAEFVDCLGELLANDPMVQSPDGHYFKLV